MNAKKHIDVSSLEEKHLISTLVFLMNNGPSRKIDIYAAISNNPRMPKKLDALEEMGLLRQDFDVMSRSTIINLTEKGTRVANMLINVERALNDGMSSRLH